MTRLARKEKDLRLRLRDVLRDLSLLASHRDLIYFSEEEGPIIIDDLERRLVFDVSDDSNDDNQTTYITALTSDRQLTSRRLCDRFQLFRSLRASLPTES
jgi:hypothetical protein